MSARLADPGPSLLSEATVEAFRRPLSGHLDEGGAVPSLDGATGPVIGQRRVLGTGGLPGAGTSGLPEAPRATTNQPTSAAAEWRADTVRRTTAGM